MKQNNSDDLVAILGGTGLNWQSDSSPLQNARDEIVETRWGRALVTRAEFAGRETLFLQRHAAPPHDASTRDLPNANAAKEASETSTENVAASTRETESNRRVPPHRVNYRANIAALKKLGATAIFASMAVGSLRREWPPGTLISLDDFLDFTGARDKTFFDDAPVHIDCTQPHCERLRALLQNAAAQLSLDLIDGGVYACADGPRFESAAEIRAYRTLGADVVGMTGVPEIVLAREANISYCGLAIVTNFAAGVLPQPLTQAEVLDAMREALPRVAQLFSAAARHYQDDASTRSRRVTEEYGFPDVL